MCISGGACVAQSVEGTTLAQVMILRSLSSSPAAGLCADSWEPGACFRFCVFSPCLSLARARALSLSVLKVNKHTYIIN